MAQDLTIFGFGWCSGKKFRKISTTDKKLFLDHVMCFDMNVGLIFQEGPVMHVLYALIQLQLTPNDMSHAY